MITAPKFGLFTLGVNSPGDTVDLRLLLRRRQARAASRAPEENNAPEIGDVTASPTIGEGPLQVSFTAAATDEDEDD